MGKTKKQNLVSVPDYAKRCGVTRPVVYTRIKDGEITPVVIADRLFIDLETTPIKGAKRRGNRTSAEILQSIKQKKK